MADRSLPSSARRTDGPLPRRHALLLFGAAGTLLLTRRATAAAAVAATSPACIVRPEQTEGPYFIDERLERSDLRSDPTTGAVCAGVPLRLVLAVAAMRNGACTPLPDAQVDVWHCDAEGQYSDVADGARSTVGRRFLRGYQRTDSGGIAAFITIYPGAYAGRAVHVHFKVRAREGARTREFTSQLYFDDALSDRVHAAPPYAGRRPRTRNVQDGLFRAGGAQLLLAPVETPEGFAARFALGLSMA